MQALKVLFVFAASFMMFAKSQITRPDAVLTQLDGIEALISDYQLEIYNQIREIRLNNGGLLDEFHNRTLTLIDERIRSIGDSDTSIAENLKSQTQNSCINLLIRKVDEVIEFSGYDLAICIEDPGTVERVNDAVFNLLDGLERKISAVPQVIINALYGRNIFTQGAEIVEKAQELLESKQTEINADLESIKSSSTLNQSWEESISTLSSCFDFVDSEVCNAFNDITAKISTCNSFGNRGGRSLPIIDVLDYFPRLREKLDH